MVCIGRKGDHESAPSAGERATWESDASDSWINDDDFVAIRSRLDDNVVILSQGDDGQRQVVDRIDRSANDLRA
jgi:hypothetical protein